MHRICLTVVALTALALTAGCGPKADDAPPPGSAKPSAPISAAPPSQTQSAQQGQSMADYMKKTNGGKK